MSALIEGVGVMGSSAGSRGEPFLDVAPAYWDLLPVASYICDREGHIVRFNRKAAEIWGREPKLGDPADRYCGSFRMRRLDGAIVTHAQCPMAEVLRSGVAVSNREIMIERPDGARIVALVNIAPLRNSGGEIGGAINCFQDVTEFRAQSDAVAQVPVHTILDALPAAIYTTDAAGKLTYFNKAAVELAGREPRIGNDEWCVSWKLYWPDGRPLPHNECPMAVALKEGRPIRGVEAVAERQDGSRVPFEPYPTPLRDATGKIVGAVNMLVDLTGRKHAETGTLLLSTIVETSDDAIVSKDLNGVITSWNKGAERIFGYLAEEVMGKSITILIPPDNLSEETTIIERIRRGERIDHYETVRRRKDGSLIDVSLTVSPLKNPSGKIIGASKIARDITDRKRKDAQIAMLAREAEHRTKNVLATVQAAVQLSEADTVEGFKAAISGRIQALANVHSLFVQSRWLGADLHTLIKQELAPYAGSGQVRASTEGPNVTLDPNDAQALAVTLHELVTNAAKYGALSTESGGLRIEWSRLDEILALNWIETGGPPARTPARKGFGMRVMEAMIQSLPGGDIRIDWRPEGLACFIRMRL